MTNLKNIDYWEKLLKEMPSSYKEWFEEEKKFLTKNIKENSKVLEVGCGDGRSLKDIIDVTKNLTGIDHDDKAIKDAKNNFKNISQVKLLVAKAEELPFNNDSFDYVICMTTFANFGDKKYEVLDEMKRVLKDNGSIIISVYGEDALEERMKMYRKLKAKIKDISKDGTVTFDEWGGDNTSEQFSKNKLLNMFKKAKLGVEQIKKVKIAYICKVKKE